MSDLQELKVGSTRIVALKDGELSIPKEILLNLDEDTSNRITQENNELTLNNVNAYLIFKDNKILLVDAGCRDLFGPTCGFVHNEIKKANVKPEDITDIFFTHLHPDHVAGAIDKDGKSMFPNAIVKVIEDEFNFWNRDDFDDVEINGKNFADLNKAVMKAYDNKIETIKSNQEIISGIYPVSLPGHTPGHSGFRVDDENNSFVQMGDVLHAPNLQLSNPDISVLFDVDLENGMRSRKQVFDMVCNDKLMCSGGHMLEPKFGYLERFQNGYKFVT
ncbi:MBL fold metallo-hydrolase [Alphaproteobacteria bacterium]|nr:MBL fold metallo-hydrolase [Alphaproteobacteria bacterium]